MESGKEETPGGSVSILPFGGQVLECQEMRPRESQRVKQFLSLFCAGRQRIPTVNMLRATGLCRQFL